MKYLLYLTALPLLLSFTACRPVAARRGAPAPLESCDTASLQLLPLRNYKKVFYYWRQGGAGSLDDFLRTEGDRWRAAKAWHDSTFPIAGHPLLQCLGSRQQGLFLYIPHRFLKSRNNDSDLRIAFYLVNNTDDTLRLPRLDATIDNISSSIAADRKNWKGFQQTTPFVACGNSRWAQRLPPRWAVSAEIECDYLFVGDTLVEYRLELKLPRGQILVSNAVRVPLLREQLAYAGREIEWRFD